MRTEILLYVSILREFFLLVLPSELRRWLECKGLRSGFPVRQWHLGTDDLAIDCVEDVFIHLENYDNVSHKNIGYVRWTDAVSTKIFQQYSFS